MSDLEDKIHAALLAQGYSPTGIDAYPYYLPNVDALRVAMRALDGVIDAINEIEHQFDEGALDRGAKAAEKTPAQYKDDMIAKIEESSLQKANIIASFVYQYVSRHAERESGEAMAPHGL